MFTLNTSPPNYHESEVAVIALEARRQERETEDDLPRYEPPKRGDLEAGGLPEG